MRSRPSANEVRARQRFLKRQAFEQLAQGGRVELRGFGAFSTRQRDARVGRNPRTGDPVSVNAKRVPVAGAIVSTTALNG